MHAAPLIAGTLLAKDPGMNTNRHDRQTYIQTSSERQAGKNKIIDRQASETSIDKRQIKINKTGRQEKKRSSILTNNDDKQLQLLKY